MGILMKINKISYFCIRIEDHFVGDHLNILNYNI